MRGVFSCFSWWEFVLYLQLATVHGGWVVYIAVVNHVGF